MSINRASETCNPFFFFIMWILFSKHGHGCFADICTTQGWGTRGTRTLSNGSTHFLAMATKPRLERSSHTEMTNRKRCWHDTNIRERLKKSTRTYIWLYRMCHAGLDGMWHCMCFKGESYTSIDPSQKKLLIYLTSRDKSFASLYTLHACKT